MRHTCFTMPVWILESPLAGKRGAICAIPLIASSIGLALAILTGCGSSTPPLVLSATLGTGQKALPGATFATPLTTTVTRGGQPVSGLQVTFTAPSSGASGTFANGTATDTATTGAEGVATSTQFTANRTAGNYSVTATASAQSASFDLTNIAATYYSFNLNGLEVVNRTHAQPNYYALAGSVALDSSGNVVAGEQDYNDGIGLTSQQPSGDSITGGSLVVDSTGQGTLTLTTNNSALGSSGTETLGVQFVNANHALVVQFDGSATSSGSIDLQTLPSSINGGYAFTLSGVDVSYNPVVYGGIFSANSGAITGTVDVNDDGTIGLGDVISGALANADNFGRGQLTGINVNGASLTFNYYIVGPEAMRIIDVDTNHTALGLAFGQGTNATAASNASLANSVFGLQTNSWGFPLSATAGMLTPNPGSGTFTGVGDAIEEATMIGASPISGTYSLASNGRGSLTINGGLLNIASLGLYAVDPTLNVLDVNNPMGGGGALIVDLDPALLGASGVLIPQTDTASSSFTGKYAFGAQEFNGTSAVGWEFDLLGQGTVSSFAFGGTGIVNDAFGFFSATPTTYTGATFGGTASADAANPGRYTVTPLNITAITGSPVPFSVAVYQANGSQLFWLNADAVAGSLYLGTLQQIPPNSLAALHARMQQMAKTQAKHKR
jgi:hypothetical protein